MRNGKEGPKKERIAADDQLVVEKPLAKQRNRRLAGHQIVHAFRILV